MSVRGQGGPDREKAYYTEEVPREPGLPLRQHPPGLHQAGRHSFKSIDKSTFNGETKIEKGRPRSLNTTQRSQPTGEGSAWWAARPISRDGRERAFSYRSPRPPFSHPRGHLNPREHASQRNTAKGRTAHRRHTRQRTGKRRRRSEPGTSEDRPGTLQEHHEDRKQSACTRAQSGGARDAARQPTLPRLGGRRAKETTTHGGHSETRDRERRSPRRASQEPPRTTARSAWGLSQGSGRITAPLPSTHHRQRWGGETRGPLAEREERPPFAMNVRPSPGAA